MKLGIYAVHDSKAKAARTPFPSATNELAMRGFAAACQEPTSDVSKFPADFNLFHVADFDCITMEITEITPPESLGNGLVAMAANPAHNVGELPLAPLPVQGGE